MIDDRTAEHVPGCNMAFYTWALKQVNGFDPQFRKAGDDVDFIWRLQHLGYSIGFSPAAQVWHYRRNTVKAYLKQQRGYGEAEALLKYKHPDHFNTLGASHWRGKIYGGDSDRRAHRRRRHLPRRVRHRPVPDDLPQAGVDRSLMMLMSIEWHLLAAFVAVLGLALHAAAVGGAGDVPDAGRSWRCIAAMQAPRPRHRHWLTRPLIAYLHFRQPITRGWARYSVRLKAQGPAARRPRLSPAAPAAVRPARPRHAPLLEQAAGPLHAARQDQRSRCEAAGWRCALDSGWDGWDMEIYGSRYVKVRLTTATEHHHDIGQADARPRRSR